MIAVLLRGVRGASGDRRHGDEGNTHRGPGVNELQVPRSGTAARLAPGVRRVPIRYKLAAAMTLPLVILVLVLGFEVRELERSTDEVRRQTELATAANGPSGLLTSLQDERNWAAVELTGQADQVTLLVEGYDETRRRTDARFDAFRARLERSEAESRQAFAPAVEGLAAGLDQLRQRIDGDQAEHTLENLEFGNEIFDSYAQLIEPFFAGTTQVAGVIVRGDLRQGAELIDVSARQIETIANLARDVIITSLLQGGLNEPQELTNVSALLSQFQRDSERLRSRTTGVYRDTAGDELFVDFAQALTDHVHAAMHGDFDFDAMVHLINLPPEDSYNGYQDRVANALQAEAKDLSDGAIRRERLCLALIALTVTLALGLMLVVSLSITRSLQALTRQAVDMANRGLAQAISEVLDTPVGEDVVVPELDTITVETRDEVDDVATVLNAVQRSAIELAVEQALMRRNLADSFVSLGRRNQNLLSRQLDFITQLEQGETDADTLAQLFQLDHLATRMRRNAESLLVLAGNESPRRWTEPVRITDIIRAAVSEVEDYQRVVVRVAEPIAIAGSAAADLAHLLAELIENALLFSPPAETVEIRGLTQMAGYTLAIIDTGLGLSSDDVARANRRLAGGESFTVAPSKYLGHYVAGNLAVRHNIHVRLQHSVRTGITATVHIPASLMVPELLLLPAGPRRPAELTGPPAASDLSPVGWTDGTNDRTDDGQDSARIPSAFP